MYTKRLHYLLPKLSLKALIMTFVASTFLSACGIKGDLYQTPEEPVNEKEVAEGDENNTLPKAIGKLESEQPTSAQQQLEQPSKQPVESVLESTVETVKEP